MPAADNWTIIVSPYDPNLRMAKFECPKCRQSMLTSDPDKAVFVHCSRRDFLTIPQRDSLLSGDPHAAEKQARANHAALESAKNQQTPHHFNEAAAFEAVRAAVIRDAEAFEAKRREQAEYDLRTPLPRQTVGAPQGEQYIPSVKDV